MPIVNTEDETTLQVKPNFYAKKVASDQISDVEANSHAVGFPVCNFSCQFCGVLDPQKEIPKDEFSVYTAEAFRQKVVELLCRGEAKSFKFTGGEISLVRNLPRLLAAVKQEGGSVFLDTNGSMPSIVISLVRQGLVDVLAVSLKGMNSDDAKKTAGISNEKLSWSNPIETIKECTGAESSLVVPVTFVVDEKTDLDTLVRFADFLTNFERYKSLRRRSIRLKINNYQPISRETGLKAFDRADLMSLVKQLVENRPEWTGRTVVVLGKDGISGQGGILKI